MFQGEEQGLCLLATQKVHSLVFDNGDRQFCTLGKWVTEQLLALSRVSVMVVAQTGPCSLVTTEAVSSRTEPEAEAFDKSRTAVAISRYELNSLVSINSKTEISLRMCTRQ